MKIEEADGSAETANLFAYFGLSDRVRWCSGECNTGVQLSSVRHSHQILYRVHHQVRIGIK